jgi:hypothetical protein
VQKRGFEIQTISGNVWGKYGSRHQMNAGIKQGIDLVDRPGSKGAVQKVCFESEMRHGKYPRNPRDNREANRFQERG